jgi:hypothetical protein
MIFFRKSSVRLNVGILEKLVKILSLQQYNPVNISCKGRDVYGDEVRSGIVRCWDAAGDPLESLDVLTGEDILSEEATSISDARIHPDESGWNRNMTVAGGHEWRPCREPGGSTWRRPLLIIDELA